MVFGFGSVFFFFFFGFVSFSLFVLFICLRVSSYREALWHCQLGGDL